MFCICIQCYAIWEQDWPVKEEYVTRLEMSDSKIIRRMCNFRLEDRISADELVTRLKLNSILQCLQV